MASHSWKKVPVPSCPAFLHFWPAPANLSSNSILAIFGGSFCHLRQTSLHSLAKGGHICFPLFYPYSVGTALANY